MYIYIYTNQSLYKSFKYLVSVPELEECPVVILIPPTSYSTSLLQKFLKYITFKSATTNYKILSCNVHFFGEMYFFLQYYLFQLLGQRMLTFGYASIITAVKKIYFYKMRSHTCVFKKYYQFTIAMMFERMIIIKILTQNASNID